MNPAPHRRNRSRYWVWTVGKNDAAVGRYIQKQEKEDPVLNNWRSRRFERFTLGQASGFAGGRSQGSTNKGLCLRWPGRRAF